MEIDIGCLLTKRARLSGARPAIIADQRRLTFGALEAEANRIAKSLVRSGVRAGDRVATLQRNSAEYVVLYYAAAKIGAILCGINWRLAVPEIEFILGDAEPRLLIHSREFEAVAKEFARPGMTVCAADAIDDPLEKQIPDGASLEYSAQSEPDRALVLVYTSGTTGRPKGAVLTHRQMFWASATMAASHDYRHGDVNMVPTPLFHVGGLSFATLFVHMGATLLLPRAWDPGHALQLIAAERVNHFFAVPTMLRSLCEHVGFATADFTSLRWILSGGSALAPDLIDAFAARGLLLQQTYGATETAGPATLVDADHVARKPGSAGIPYFHTDIRIAGPKGATLPPGEVGEVQVRAPHVFAGYWRNPEAAAAAFAGGWLKTGDLGRQDADGYLYIVDRAKDMILSGGENIYPAEIEAVLAYHPEIAEVAVVGVADPHWGEVPCAVVVPKPGCRPNLQELQQRCETMLARYKVPRRFEFRDLPLPRNATGKVLKHEIRAALIGRNR